MNQTKGVLVPPAYQIFLKVRPPLLFSLSNIGLTLKKMATHSSILTWEIPWTEEPAGLQSMGGPGGGAGHKRVRQTERLYNNNIISIIIISAPPRSSDIRSQRLGTLCLLSPYY